MIIIPVHAVPCGAKDPIAEFKIETEPTDVTVREGPLSSRNGPMGHSELLAQR